MTMTTTPLLIDPDLQSLIPPLDPLEKQQLEANILQDGCRDPLVVWQPDPGQPPTLIDGHNRYDICTRHNLPFSTTTIDLPSKASVRLWMLENQTGRRNLSPAWRIELALASKDELLALGRARMAHTPDHEAPHDTRAALAKAAGVSSGMIAMAEKLRASHPDVWEQVKAGELTVSAGYRGLNKLPDEQPQQLTEPTPETQPPVTFIEEEVIPDPPTDPTTQPGDLWLLGEHRVLCGNSMDASDLEKLMNGVTAQCCITSPPYWGLRQYDTVTWEGGDPECDHMAPVRGGRESSTLHDASQRDGDSADGQYLHVCGKCGALRHDHQLGLEPTPEAFVANMVKVFQGVASVLRDDGTCWLNLGSSYSNAVPNMTDCVNRVLKGCSVFGFDAETVASPAKGVDVSAHDQRSPDGELTSLLGTERKSVEKRDNDFREIIDCFAVPRHGRTGISCVAGLVLGGAAATDTMQDVVNGAGVIFADLNANLQAELAVLRPVSTRSGRGDDAPLAIKEPSEPRTEDGIAWHTAWDSFSLAAGGKGIPDVDLMNQAVPLRNGAMSFACLLRDFKITQASEQKVTFTSVGGGIRLVVSDVRHLTFSFLDGCIVPYVAVYDKAIRLSNRSCAKQEIDTPNMVKAALQEDGWICRQTIIWSKPSPLPEPVTDRCVKSHEYLFLLSKKPRYYFDHHAIKEPAVTNKIRDGFRGGDGTRYVNNRSFDNDADAIAGGGSIQGDGTRNKRSVWTVASQPYAGAHFATFPLKLIEPCILAGTSEKGCCPTCGAPHERVVEKTPYEPPSGERSVDESRGDKTRKLSGKDYNDSVRVIGESWRPTCECPDHEPVPCTILDPFLGAGTTLIVAEQMSRTCFGMELSPAYCDLIVARWEKLTGRKADRVTNTQPQLVSIP